MKSKLRIILNRFPLFKRYMKFFLNALMQRQEISADYIEVKGQGAVHEATRLSTAWQEKKLPMRQRKLVNDQLEKYRNGVEIDVFDVLVGALRDLCKNIEKYSVLEIGCSSGFYSEVFKIASLPVLYSGCDYSEPFIALARKIYPTLHFKVEDATGLSYSDNSFDVAISGCCLLHIPEYEMAVSETARVARRYAIFHRTPVLIGQPNKYFRKLAYGIETIEIHFNEDEFIDLLSQYKLEIVATYTLSEDYEDHDQSMGHANRTYVCKKIT